MKRCRKSSREGDADFCLSVDMTKRTSEIPDVKVITVGSFVAVINASFRKRLELAAPKGCNCRLSARIAFPPLPCIVEVVCDKHGLVFWLAASWLCFGVGEYIIHAGTVVEFALSHYRRHTRRLRK